MNLLCLIGLHKWRYSSFGYSRDCLRCKKSNTFFPSLRRHYDDTA